jgi:aminoglycoside phosphotransferase (APT) family kinase protein
MVRHVRALIAAGAPIVPLADGTPQPVAHGPWTATVWPWLNTRNAPVQPTDLGQTLKAFHRATTGLRVAPAPAADATEPDTLDGDDWRPVTKALRRIRNTRRLPPHHAEWTKTWAQHETDMNLNELLDWLQAWAQKLETQFQQTEWTLPQGLVHGDAHTGNLLATTDGRLLFCDLDSVYYGPREWDLVPTAHSSIRFGKPRTNYLAFAAAYGVDIT